MKKLLVISCLYIFQSLLSGEVSLADNIKVSGRIQAQYDQFRLSEVEGDLLKSGEKYYFRSIVLGATLDVTKAAQLDVRGEFGEGTGDLGEVDRLKFSYNSDKEISLSLGYDKVPIGLEELTSSASVKGIERSIATRFFTEQFKYGGRFSHVTLKWQGEHGFYTGITVGGNEPRFVGSPHGFDELGYWLNLGKKGNRWGAKENVGMTLAHIESDYHGWKNDVIGNLYYRLTAEKWETTLEFFQAWLENGSGDKEQPIAYHLIQSYRLNDKVEFVGRAAFVESTAALGADISSTLRKSPMPANSVFADADAYYLGINWYEARYGLRISAGYEWTKYCESSNVAVADVNAQAVRIRFQYIF